MPKITPRLIIMIILSSLFATACQASTADVEQPVIVVATRDGLDAGYNTYEHPSGVFSIRIPPSWVIDELPDRQGVRVQFSTLEGDESVVRLSVYVVNTGVPMTQETFINTADTYQPPDDVSNLEWTQVDNPVDMADRSRRLSGIRQYPRLGARAFNIFMQGNGTYFSVLEIDVTDASRQILQTLEVVANTFRVNPDNTLEVGEVVAANTSFSGDVAFESYQHWNDDGGGFNITGRVINTTDEPLESVRIIGYLFDNDGNQLSEKSLILTTDLIEANGTAPFRLRFDTGRPSQAVRYELHAAARVANLTTSDFYGAENFEVQQNDARYNENGNLVLSGSLVNLGSRVATGVKVVVGVLDESDDVVASEWVFVDRDQLLPGEAGNYELVISDIGGAGIRYELTVMGTAQ